MHDLLSETTRVRMTGDGCAELRMEGRGGGWPATSDSVGARMSRARPRRPPRPANACRVADDMGNVRGERAKDQILDAAAAEFLLHGVAASTVERILERSGLSRGAVHWHFKTKHEMAAALVEQKHDLWPEVIKGVHDAGFQGSGGVRELMRRAALILRDDIRARAAMRIAPEIAGGVPGPAAYERWADALEEFLRQGVRSGEVLEDCDVRSAARVIVRACLGVYMSATETGTTERLEEQLDELWVFLLPSMLAEQRRKR